MLKGWDVPRIEAVIADEINAILAEKSLPARAVSPADKLSDTLGLSSLDLAVLVSELELAFNADPFAQLVPITDVRTVSDLVQAYRLALMPHSTPARANDDLSVAAERARQRSIRRRK